jgi:DNA-binding NarL/FixJ family response regulator
MQAAGAAPPLSGSAGADRCRAPPDWVKVDGSARRPVVRQDPSKVALLGRDDLLGQGARLLREHHSVVVTGPAGAGKSAVVRALAARSEAAGRRVLRCSPVAAEAGLPFLSLIDLLAGLEEDPAWHELAPPWKAALAAVRDGGAPGADQARQLAIRLAVLHLCRGLARQRPVLLVVDDLQWVDSASAEVLGFVARRVGNLPVQVVAAERVAAEPGAAAQLLELCPAPVTELPLPPLPAPVVAELLRRHTGSQLAPSLLARVHSASNGNPLIALEIARALRRLPRLPGPEEPLPVPDRLRALLRARLARLPQPAQRCLLLASAAARPTTTLLQRAGRRRATAELAAASAAGIVQVGHGGVVRFTHPLLAATVYAEAAAGQRQRAHSRLAAAVADPIERARHRALAATGPDEAIAAALIRAARLARRRGAPQVAAELALVAADRTPQPARAAGRLLHAAADALAAGHCEQARQAAEAVLAVAGTRRLRVQAWLVILDAASQALAHADPVIAQATEAAGDDPALQARIRVRVVGKALVEGRLPRALAEARRCCLLAERAGDRATLVRALCMQATAELAMGLPQLAGTLRRAQAVADGDRLGGGPAGGGSVEAPLYQGPRHLLARTYLNQDRFDAARAELLPLLALAAQRGQVEDLVGLQLNLAEVELRAGRCRAALRAAHRGLELVADADLSAGPSLAVAALAEAAGGDPDRARGLAQRGVERSEADGDRFFLPRNLHALGYAALVAGDPVAAVAALRRVAEIEAGMAELDPALFRWHADLAEALVANRELAGAADVIRHARQVARRRHRGTVLAALARAEALLLLARREPAAAAGQLQAAAGQLRALPLEYARTLHALGVAERRRRRRTAAAAAFREALVVFDRAGALPWARRTLAELNHTEPAAGGGLTSIEHRIAGLVSTGATNQQVAAALSVSVKTVEAYLTRIYRKLRVRSRAELAGSFAGRTAPPAGPALVAGPASGDIKGFS